MSFRKAFRIWLLANWDRPFKQGEKITLPGYRGYWVMHGDREWALLKVVQLIKFED